MAFHKARALQEAERSVSQGKTAHAIKRYQEILENDPSDVSLLNTIGDLYVRDRNITEGLRQFHRLAEAYVREGFNVKAIAIYRKISKVDPHSVETLMKLAELYQVQGLGREAREQYLQAADFFKQRRQTDRLLEVIRKVVQLDPQNVTVRHRLAAEYEQAEKRDDAAHTYLEEAEILLRRGDHVPAETALDKAAELDPNNSKIQILRARVEIMLGKHEEAEKIIRAAPQLLSDLAGKRILLDSYLGSGKIPLAKKLLLDMVGTDPADFSPVSAVCAVLLDSERLDEARDLLASLVDTLILHHHTGQLIQALRRIWAAEPQHIPTMELIHRICEKGADEATLPEVLEGLGHAYQQAGDLEEAETAYLELSKREPQNEQYRGLLNAIHKKLGKQDRTVASPANPTAPPGQAAVPCAQAGSEQELMVQEALENSELFGRYNLAERAFAELDKVLKQYPDRIDVHQRILELSWDSSPERRTAAAAQLARIFTGRGDTGTAGKYHAIASGQEDVCEIPLPPLLARSEVEESAAARPRVETPFDLTPAIVSSESAVAMRPLTGQTMELDLSWEVDAMAAIGDGTLVPSTDSSQPVLAPGTEVQAPTEIGSSDQQATSRTVEAPGRPRDSTSVHQAAVLPTEILSEMQVPASETVKITLPSNFEESRVEVEFYLENGFVEEARHIVLVLEQKYPGSPFVAGLRQMLDRAGEAAAGQITPNAPFSDARAADLPLEIEQPESGAESLRESSPVGEEPPPAALNHPESPGGPSQPRSAVDTPTVLAAATPQPAVTANSAPPKVESTPSMASLAAPVHNLPETGAEGAPPPDADGATDQDAAVPAIGGTDASDDFAGEMASALDGLEEPAAISEDPAVSSENAASPAAGLDGAAQLSGLLEEMKGPGDAAADLDDPETHYGLGVAFREMGLLDEAIGEFQKVVKGARKGNFPPNFLQACSLLAICFMGKKMPAIAARWYLRALEIPDLDEDASMALQYDLGVAYEQAGDSRRALESYTDVYSQNIDFRDIAEKIREFQHKA